MFGHKSDKGLFNGHQYMPLGMLVLLLLFIPGSKYLQPAKKLISNTIYNVIHYTELQIRRDYQYRVTPYLP